MTVLQVCSSIYEYWFQLHHLDLHPDLTGRHGSRERPRVEASSVWRCGSQRHRGIASLQIDRVIIRTRTRTTISITTTKSKRQNKNLRKAFESLLSCWHGYIGALLLFTFLNQSLMTEKKMMMMRADHLFNQTRHQIFAISIITRSKACSWGWLLFSPVQRTSSSTVIWDGQHWGGTTEIYCRGTSWSSYWRWIKKSWKNKRWRW